jgi:hypothetical protein
MQNRPSQRINGSALEMIMKDVMQGIHEFTSETCCGSDAAPMEIIAVEAADCCCTHTANIIPFPVPTRE